MENVGSCHDYGYESTGKKQEWLFDKEFFEKKFENISVSGMYYGHHIRNETRKEMCGRKKLFFLERIVRSTN